MGSAVPIRMRSGSNPGGEGHEWVKRRFLIEREPDRIYLPARLEDNPHLDDEEYRAWARKALIETGLGEDDLSAWADENVFYQRIGDDVEAYDRLRRRIETIEAERGLPGNRAFYLALPPSVFPGAITGLGTAGLNSSPGWTRLVVEKPIGNDLTSARDLNSVVHRHFDEAQVYRIDHYLGKETVQNLMAFRFSNPMFESVWNRDHRFTGWRDVPIRKKWVGVGRRAWLLLGMGAAAGGAYYYLLHPDALTVMPTVILTNPLQS